MSVHKEQENIVIVGGGIIGCTTAYYLTHHPRFDASRHTVTIIEAAKIANGASSKAGGLLASWASPGNIAVLSFDLHSQLATEHQGAELWGYRRVRCGQLTAVSHPAVENRDVDPEEEAWRQSNSTIQLGKWWKREQTNGSVLPADLDWFKSDSAQSYEEFADASSTAQVHPLQFTAAIVKLAEKAGARIIFGTVEHVNCSDRDGESEVPTPLADCHDWSQKKVVSLTYTDKTTSKQTIPATTVVLAAGPWTSTLLPKLRMSPLRAHSITIKLKRPVSAYCLFTEITIKEPSRPARPGALSKSPSSKTFCPEIYSRPNNEVYICSQGDLNVPLPSPTMVVAVSEQSCKDIIDAAASVSDELRNGQTALPNDPSVTRAAIAFICFYIAFFATTWGPGAWVLIGEIFPLQIRARGVGLSTASNWLWNCIIAVITPYMMGKDKGNLGTKIFFIWGSLCACCLAYAYLLIPETKGLSLEQIDRMFEETNPRNSSKWMPHSTYAADMGLVEEPPAADNGEMVDAYASVVDATNTV